MLNEFFPEIPKIPYEGPDSRNPLAFKYYQPKKKVGDKTMEEHLRFSVAYWHTLTGTGGDPFGVATNLRPWLSITDPMAQAAARMRACFEILEKLDVPFFCFHDRDIAPEGATLRETNRNLDTIVEQARELIASTGKKLLWGTACLFAHPRYVHGAATSCNADVYAYAAAQVKKAIEVTHSLGGQNYVFWGGREGYDSLINTDMGLELDNLGRFLHMAVDYAKEIGFTGQFLIEPKPMEPTAHQYDSDVEACLNFLRKYDLLPHFKINIEQNHAILAGHTYQHEIYTARINGVLGSLDANEGAFLLGWDTDQMATNLYEAIFPLYEVLKAGGLAPGGLNFDAKLRRGSFEPDDIFIGHVAAMDTYARALEVAHRLLESRELEDFVQDRYASYRDGIGAKIVRGEVGFKELEAYALEHDQITNRSGRREMLEAIVNRYL
ncbi:MAG: xylose isomerase [Spirochaetaceae bacterium]|nr:MAG: xylose isomerase [Spirochaetaceae bacterium]